MVHTTTKYIATYNHNNQVLSKSNEMICALSTNLTSKWLASVWPLNLKHKNYSKLRSLNRLLSEVFPSQTDLKPQNDSPNWYSLTPSMRKQLLEVNPCACFVKAWPLAINCVSFEEQMSRDKYPRIWRIWRIFSHKTLVNQSRVSEHFWCFTTASPRKFLKQIFAQ